MTRKHCSEDNTIYIKYQLGKKCPDISLFPLINPPLVYSFKMIRDIQKREFVD